MHSPLVLEPGVHVVSENKQLAYIFLFTMINYNTLHASYVMFTIQVTCFWCTHN